MPTPPTLFSNAFFAPTPTCRATPNGRCRCSNVDCCFSIRWLVISTRPGNCRPFQSAVCRERAWRHSGRMCRPPAAQGREPHQAREARSQQPRVRNTPDAHFLKAFCHTAIPCKRLCRGQATCGARHRWCAGAASHGPPNWRRRTPGTCTGPAAAFCTSPGSSQNREEGLSLVSTSPPPRFCRRLS